MTWRKGRTRKELRTWPKIEIARDFSAHAGHVVCVHGHRDALAHGGSVHGRRRFIVLRNHLVCASRHLTAIDVTALEAFAGRSKAAATVPVPPAVREVCPGSRKMMELRGRRTEGASTGILLQPFPALLLVLIASGNLSQPTLTFT